MNGYLDHQIVLLREKVQDRDSALHDLSFELLKAGCVREGYYEALVERENEYPTAIYFDSFSGSVAIPHASGEFVEENQIGIMILQKPVKFRQMVNRKETDVRLIFMLALKKEDQTAVLAELMKLFSDGKRMSELLQCQDTATVINILKGCNDGVIG